MQICKRFNHIPNSHGIVDFEPFLLIIIVDLVVLPSIRPNEYLELVVLEPGKIDLESGAVNNLCFQYFGITSTPLK